VRDGLTAAAVRFTDADNVPLPFLWAPSKDALYFEGISRGVRNLWKVGVDPETLEWRTGPRRLTTGAEVNEGISLSPDGRRLAFAVRNDRIRLWSFGLDAAAGRLTDDGEAITTAAFDALSPVLSRDGTRLLFEAERGGAQELWLKRLSDGHESLLVGGDRYRRVNPVWSHDDDRIMYLRTGPSATRDGTVQRQVVTIPTAGGAEQLLQTVAPFDMLLDWSSDGASILAGTRIDGRNALGLFPSDQKSVTPPRVLAVDPHSNLWKARLAPDQRWVTYTASSGPGVTVINAVPAAGGTPIALTTGEFFDDRPRWSPDGRVVYFLSNRSRFFNVWARRFDPDRGVPIGEPFSVTHLDSPAQVIPPRMVQVGLAVSGNRLILPISAVSGSIWILDGVDR
jgi:Tol biopolymer transport system component